MEKYGISVAVKQVVRPGDDQVNGNGYITSSVSFMDPGKAWLAGVNDGEQRQPTNWIRSGGSEEQAPKPPCNYDDNNRDTAIAIYEKLFENNTLLRGTWAPYAMAVVENSNPSTTNPPVYCG